MNTQTIQRNIDEVIKKQNEGKEIHTTFFLNGTHITFVHIKSFELKGYIAYVSGFDAFMDDQNASILISCISAISAAEVPNSKDLEQEK